MRHRQGMTLIEMLLVLMVIGILVGLTGYAVDQFISRAQDTGADAELDQVQKAMWAFMLDAEQERISPGICTADFSASEPSLWPRFLRKRYPGGGRSYSWDELGNVIFCEEGSSAAQAEYFAGRSLSGELLLARTDETIDFDWGYGSPDPAVPNDNFSVRWRLAPHFPQEGVYRFVTRTDDGVRLYVDGELILDEWRYMPATTHAADVWLVEGTHQIVMEYFEAGGHAVAQLSWLYGGAENQVWSGSYYDNTRCAGMPVFVRQERVLDFDWGDQPPGEGVPSTNWSARWTADIEFAESGSYRFTAVTDGGIRVIVDGSTVIDSWTRLRGHPVYHDLDLLAGTHHVDVSYYHVSGDAYTALTWEKHTPAAETWVGEYFAGRELAGKPLFVRYDDVIDFDWGAGGPGGSVHRDLFSVRWTREQELEAGRYRFSVTGDDGIRLYIDGELVIDGWRDQAARTYEAEIDLSGGTHTLIVEYYEASYNAAAKASWQKL